MNNNNKICRHFYLILFYSCLINIMLQILVHCWILYSRCHWHTQNNGHPPRVAPPVRQHRQGDVPGTHSCACLWPWGNPHSLCKWGQDASHWTTSGDDSALPPEVWHVSWPWVHVNLYGVYSAAWHRAHQFGLNSSLWNKTGFWGHFFHRERWASEEVGSWKDESVELALTKAAWSVSLLSINP